MCTSKLELVFSSGSIAWTDLANEVGMQQDSGHTVVCGIRC